jgi:four helix bundle protein
MAKIERFEDIEVWQKARILVGNIYQVTRQGSFSKDYGLKEQIQRAAVSIMSNIAEGFERKSNKEFSQFLFVAKASAGEVRSLLYVANDIGYIDGDIFSDLKSSASLLSRQISAFIKYLRTSS